MMNTLSFCCMQAGSDLEFLAVAVKLEADDGSHATEPDKTQSSEIKTEADDSGNVITERQRDAKPRPYLCKVCNKRFMTSRYLSTHSRRHAGDRMYSCCQCEKRFLWQNDLCRHMNIHRRRYRCRECGKCCQSSFELMQHRRGHSGERLFECAVCHKRFLSSRYLFLHMNIHGSKYKCPECGRCLKSAHDLAAHRRSHSGEKPFRCTICGKHFAKLHGLARHGRTHSGERPYRCLLCDKAFCGSGDLNRHTRVHLGHRPYRCSQCERTFSQSGNLQQHVRNVHARTDRKPCECPQCGQVFKSNSHLTTHVHAHSRSIYYSCRHCSDRFDWLEGLRVHLLETHNEVLKIRM